ncbi:type IV pilus biogenesis protein PilM [Burkholderia sp. SIMBA_043]|jgi:hypothetical protein|uniref:type IV pilus biogenesis protein PilM n=3 Tax=Pseudomonadati TaxID=3379134 RepID=UPI0005D75D0E|nr:type IV pilus biogenesis protein PilM [Burkholderia vietnamiensis]AJY03111.1 pilM family protein [Burkholderia vietnamiensis LMG 10929]AVR13948.1 hypothetical protein A8H33_10300 [Burkholderia vietnamiensis]UBI29179.1 type IV pilus biogenesis protein PilM [Burkholderia vietnamiensis]
MPLLIVLLMFLAFATEYEESVWTRAQNARVSQEANVVGDSMRVYRTYVQQYSTANPSYTGQVPDSVLPTWYVRPTSVNNYVSNGAVYIYNTAPPQGLVTAIATRSSYLTTVGTNVNGLLVGPSIGPASPSVSIPAPVPQQSVVITP